MLDLGIIILNYNTRDLLRDCLRSVLDDQGDFSCQVCVVDNASHDGSADMVARAFPQVHLIRSTVNGGFSYGNNLGLRAFGFHNPTQPTARLSENLPQSQFERPTYVLLLNPDTVVPPGALSGLLAFMDAHPEAGRCAGSDRGRCRGVVGRRSCAGRSVLRLSPERKPAAAVSVRWQPDGTGDGGELSVRLEGCGSR